MSINYTYKHLIPLYGLWAAVILLLLSPDSCLHELYGRMDSAIFYMCGKAWVNGMVPYTDFADSKGPLLWLVYGLGYLLSPHNFIGVYWLSVVAYTVTFLYTHKTVRIYLHNDRQSLMVTLLMTAAYFMPIVHYETRSEDFCVPFVVMALYHASALLYGEEESTRRVNMRAFAMGCCFGAVLLIKYSIAVIILLFANSLLIPSPKNKWRLIATFVLGTVIVILPFLTWFACQGNLIDFMREYLINTPITVYNIKMGQTLPDPPSEVMRRTLLYHGFLFTLALGAGLMATTVLNRWRQLPLVWFLLSFCATMQNYIHEYYLNSITVFFIFLLIALAHRYPKVVCSRTVITGVIISTLVLNMGWQTHLYHNYIWGKSIERPVYRHYDKVMGRVPHPTLIYWGLADVGIGTTAEALPGCKYWTRQYGYTKEMDDEQNEAVMSKRADFVVVGFQQQKRITALRQLGYRDYSPQGAALLLFGKE